jgi:hypothetical protein
MNKLGKEQAREQGDLLESQIRHLLTDEGFGYVDVSHMGDLAVAHNSELFRSPVGVFAEGIAAFVSNYETPFTAKFALHRPGWRTPVGLDCRGQGGSGSADAKLEHVYMNIIRFSPFPFLVILDGSGFRPAVIKWGRLRAAESAGKLVVMPGVRDLGRWAAAGFPYPSADNDLWAWA